MGVQVRFTSEFAPGGLIDEATVEEKEMAWMPRTNDVNEGALGSFRGLMRRQPCLSLLQYNAQAMYFLNNTPAFMQSFFKDEDYQNIHKLARDADGLEKRRKRHPSQYILTHISLSLGVHYIVSLHTDTTTTPRH